MILHPVLLEIYSMTERRKFPEVHGSLGCIFLSVKNDWSASLGLPHHAKYSIAFRA